MRLIDADAKEPYVLDGKYQVDTMDVHTIGAWIPVSERLPEIGQKVLASTKRTVFTQVYKGIYSEPNVWDWEHNSIKVVIAWMPMPEPYKAKSEDKEWVF